MTGSGGEEAPEAYYRPAPGGVFTATIATESPWDTKAQHGGPPCALFGHVIRENHPETRFRLARLTVEFLGAVPRSDIEVSTEIVRDGRRIRLIEAAMTSGGKRVALARAWQIAVGEDGLLDGVPLLGAKDAAVPELPEEQPLVPFGDKNAWGYGNSVEWRRVRGEYRGSGYAKVWMRPRIPLVAGQEMHPLDRVLVVADSANGVSTRLDSREWLFIPPAVTITIHRYPLDEWILIAARTELASDGIGSTTGILSDRSGPVGNVTQPLLVAPAPRG